MRGASKPVCRQACRRAPRCLPPRGFYWILSCLGLVFLLCGRSEGQTAGGLQVSFGPAGLERLSFAGQVLEDVRAQPADAFHIWHMRCTDLNGKPRTEGPYGWGEAASQRRWDAPAHAWVYTFPWGTLSVQYVVTASALDLVVKTSNNAGSGVIFDGASLYPLALHFPRLPAGFADASFPQLATNTTGPSITVADFGAAEVAAVAPDPDRPLYNGFFPTDGNTAYTVFLSGTVPDGLAVFQPHVERPLRPGQTDQYRLSLRFAASRASVASIASDALDRWRQHYPQTLHWTDRRPIGTVFLANSPQGDPHHSGGFANNPRRYFNNANPLDFDTTTAQGLRAFQRRVLEQAHSEVENLRALGAQGAITWDIEGEQFPQDTSYACAPDAIAQLAPEMESVITEPGSPWAGSKLDDAYFHILRSAGFRVGVCVRPQHFVLHPDGTAAQQFLQDSQVAAELESKIRFAHDRWGATLFYLDSTVDANRGTLPAGIFAEVAHAFPDSLLIAEESTPLFYAYTAPFKSFLFHGDVGTEPLSAQLYPHGFSAVLVNNVSPAKLAAAKERLAAQVSRGDLLMGQVDYREPNNAAIAAIYHQAKPAAKDSTDRKP